MIGSGSKYQAFFYTARVHVGSCSAVLFTPTSVCCIRLRRNKCSPKYPGNSMRSGIIRKREYLNGVIHVGR